MKPQQPMGVAQHHRRHVADPVRRQHRTPRVAPGPVAAGRADERGRDARRQARPPVDRRQVLGADHAWQVGDDGHLGDRRRPDAGHRVGEQPRERIERDRRPQFGEHRNPQLTFVGVTLTDRVDALEHAH